MTGYIEPILDGSAIRRPPFVVPVHGVPADLLQLDMRRWQGTATDGSVRAIVAGDQVLPLAGQSPQQEPAPGSALEVDPAVEAGRPSVQPSKVASAHGGRYSCRTGCPTARRRRRPPGYICH